MPIVECVPNFSEGRNSETVEQIVNSARISGVTVLGYEMDSDHNRSVVTLAGDPESVAEAAFRACATAAKLIDLNQHQGEHPRMGATDVIPFIPVSDISMDECVKLAEKLAERIGNELEIPTYLYGDAAKVEGRENLAKVRKGQFEKLKEKIGSDEKRTPDFGPNHIHPTAGATAVGARFFLIAYNVNLESQDVELAKTIGKTIREKNDGMPGVKAMGFELAEENCVQVSMNLVDYRKTSPAQAYARIEELAQEAGVSIRESELIGLLPQDALDQCAGQALKIKDFNPSEQVIEQKLGSQQFGYLSGVGDFLGDLASKSPTPGGGAAAAILGATGVALGEMVGNLTKGKKKYADVKTQVIGELAALKPLRSSILAMFEEDARAYDGFGTALKLPKDTDEQKAARAAAMQNALQGATLSPDKTAELGIEALRHVAAMAKIGNKNAISDCGVGALSLYACVRAAVMNMRINLPGIKDEDFRTQYVARADEFDKEAQSLLDSTMKVVTDAIGK